VRRKEARILAQRLDSPPWQCSSSQGALCQTVSGKKKKDYWNGTPALFPWFGSKWFLVFPKAKSILKRQRHRKKRCDDSTEN
jgi:hypothetical protein